MKAKAITLLAAVGIFLIVLGAKWPHRVEATYWGPLRSLGHGAVQTFFTVGADGIPQRLGLTFSSGLLEGLPEHMNTTSRCFDTNQDGRIADHGECLGDYERVLELPAEVRGYPLPFQWATINWNPEGHLPPAPPVWSAPHFDFHFYATDRATVSAIRPGACGEFIDCADFERATKAVPAAFLPRDYIDVGAAVPAMGNHLIDSKAAEFGDPPAPFTATFIFGAFDGELIFWEPMITRAYLLGNPNECRPVKQPQAFQRSGYYPTAYCVRHAADTGTFTVSLERLVYAESGAGAF